MASADSEFRPKPRPLTIPPRQINAREAGPKAYLSTASLLNLAWHVIPPVSG
jgi:hypothetical protein